MEPSTSVVEQLLKYQSALVILNTLTPVTIAIIGWFVKRTIERVESRLDSHEKSISSLIGSVQRLIGRSESWDGRNRRT